jgi:glycosyltransferase involved in cell wall biosynthesis
LTNPPFLSFCCAVLNAVGLRKKYIYLIFDVYPDTAVKLGVIRENGIAHRLWQWLNLLSLKHATSVVVIGRCMKDVIIKNSRSALPDNERKIRHIPVWSDDNLIRSAGDKPNPFVSKWGLQGKFVVSYSGNMGRFHDLETIMDAVKILQPYSDMEFLFIGEGQKKAFVESFIAENKLRNCQVHTYVDREDLGFSLSAADVGLVSLADGQAGLSVPSKTYGILAAGVPVVAIMPESSEIALMLEEEECGVVVKPGESDRLAQEILGLYQDRNKLKLMAEKARKAITKKYNLDAVTTAYYGLISGI